VKIVADENIPFLEKFFGPLGHVTCLPGREIVAEDLRDADVLIVRSVTKVDKQLLEYSNLKFVGTCTIGTDHLDLDYLKQRNIPYASAPGGNANSVVEYLLSSLSILSESLGLDFDQLSIGIVGYGNIGSLLAKRLRLLGIAYKACDPLLNESMQDDYGLVSFEEVLQCDVVTLHVPLTRNGEHATHHLLDEARLLQLNAKQVLINTSRGEVVDNEALRQRLEQPDAPTVILDVWENEPCIDPVLARQVFLGTPHIAGYSFDGKVAGTEIIYQRLCQCLGLPTRYKAAQFLEEPPLSTMSFTSTASPEWCLHTAIRACFDVRHDHSLLMRTMHLAPEKRAYAFDHLRKTYRCRREFSGVKIQLKNGDSALHSQFKGLGFKLKA